MAHLANLTARALCPRGVIQARPMHLLPSHRAHSGPYLPSAPSAHTSSYPPVSLTCRVAIRHPSISPSPPHCPLAPTPLPPRSKRSSTSPRSATSLSLRGTSSPIISRQCSSLLRSPPVHTYACAYAYTHTHTHMCTVACICERSHRHLHQAYICIHIHRSPPVRRPRASRARSRASS